MENWELDKVIKWGRKSMWMVIICLAIPIAEGFLIGFQEGLGLISESEANEKYEEVTPLSGLASVIILPAFVMTILTATEASGRTRKNRVTIKQLNRKFTSKEVEAAADLYYDNPTTFPWHHITMIPQWGMKLHLKNGWCGIPQEIIKDENAYINLDKEV